VRLDTASDQFLSSEVLWTTAELDVDAATGHVGGDRYGTGAASLGDDLTLTLCVLWLRVEDRMRDSALGEHRAEQL
jgi:hypothetical protein